MKRKIVAISSQGGHWVQMKRLLPAFDDSELVLISTFEIEPILQENTDRYYSVVDASRWNKLKLIKQALQVFYIVIKENPDLVISTGASVGIWAIGAGMLVRAKTVWIDSIANYSRISLSGKLAQYISSFHLTQWPHLMSGNTIYKGSVI
nr:hypothetical protein [uncultured Draconibacterium sp.]